MARRIPDETLQAIRDRISIVEVISAYVNLKRQGRNHIGLCPFHGEKTPSFTVSDERGLYHCFGCGESGTVFSFVMKMERIEFLDAVTQLAARAGVALPAADSDDPRGAATRAALRRQRARRALLPRGPGQRRRRRRAALSRAARPERRDHRSLRARLRAGDRHGLVGYLERAEGVARGARCRPGCSAAATTGASTIASAAG